MKKIKISELPLYTSLKGLFTIGTDKDNRSVKVSLEFVEEETNKAVNKANEATTAALAAKTATETATRNAQTATTNANTATSNAQKAATTATTAAGNATSAAGRADTAATNAKTTSEKAAAAAKKTAEDAAKKATDAATLATTAKNDAVAATNNAIQATEDAQEATNAAQLATEQTIAALARLIPTGLKVESISRITYGNTAVNRIEASLTPDGTMPNIIFISDNEAVRIDQKGRIKVVGIGVSEVQIIPTCNTDLAKTIIIRVEAPTLRMVNTRKKLRLISSGAIRLN